MNNFVGHLTRKKVKGNTEQQDLSSTLTSLNLVGTEDVGQSLSGNIIEREISGNTEQKKLVGIRKESTGASVEEIQISSSVPTNPSIKLWYEIDEVIDLDNFYLDR